METDNTIPLSKDNLSLIDSAELVKPSPALFKLQEKVLQFGTGVLLRGLPDYFIDEANRNCIFNGRIVIVKSTGSGKSNEFDQQNGLYTLCIRGIQQGRQINRNIVCSAISRVLSATIQWADVLDAAKDPCIKTIISNTTEVGIQYHEESIFQAPPVSFPAKLLACLHTRYESFENKTEAGMVILPTELISNNGETLKTILNKLAEYNKLEENFINWLNNKNTFCNTLVDCIVPGYPDASFRKQFEQQFGYTDQLLTVSEVYRLWAIEGNEELKEKLPFASLDNGIVIAPDIQKFKELKLRLLNGTHTLSCGLAFLSGIQTVKEAMDNQAMSAYISQTMLEEIAPAIPIDLPLQEAIDFSHQVLDRFRNPGIAHQWINITLQYSSKIAMRCVPVLLEYHTRYNKIPNHIALGFAAYLLFMKGVKNENGQYFGSLQGKEYPIKDDYAAYYYSLWQNTPTNELVKTALQNKNLFGHDLSTIQGFEKKVLENLIGLLHEGGTATLINFLK
ncbi:tagaturonate reductase [Flavihumibacter profundi]|uniref:tagaturonate reductase n=1 Tax=Flavihumibacter profundi TaxID=2716883 RepID=UPI001CC7D023|nr:tagaturonate reductase [Flavihumibacter profundi]MBZ5855997.1 tagaturonate reductase [Flavihumibacter profundi]